MSQFDTSRPFSKSNDGGPLNKAEADFASQHLPIVKLTDVSKTFKLANGSQLRALDRVSLQIRPGEIVSLVGESGSGKSTLGRILLGLTAPDEGEIILGGHKANAVSPRLRRARPSIQPVFQDSSAAFNPRRKIFEALAQADRLNPDAAGDQSERLASLLDQVGLDPGLSFLDRYPHELSGGQRQRLAIARALAANPDIVIADEPLSGADVSIRGQVLNLLLDLRATRNISILFVTHDISIARVFSDSVAVLFKGKIVESGIAREILSNPQHPYTQKLLAAVPKATF